MADGRRQAFQALQRLFAPLGVARAQRRSQQRFQQVRLAVGRGAEDAQVPRPDPHPRELVGGTDDLAVGLVVDGLALAFLRLHDSVVLELADQLLAGAGLLDDLLQRQVGARGVDEDRPPHAPRGGLALAAVAAEDEVAAGGELLADHPQRQELVALQAQDRPQPFDVGLAVEAVAAGGPPRAQQLLVLEVADLRDRDVVELALEDFADGANRQRLARAAGRPGAPGLFGYRHLYLSR